MIAPALRSRLTTPASSGTTDPKRLNDPAVVFMPEVISQFFYFIYIAKDDTFRGDRCYIILYSVNKTSIQGTYYNWINQMPYWLLAE